MACQTQWRIAPLGGMVGLDYGGVRDTLWLQCKRRSADMFERLRVIEAAALKYFKEVAAKKNFNKNR